MLNRFRKGSTIRAEEDQQEREYRSFLSAKEIIIAYALVNDTSERVAEARITFVRTLFTMSNARFKEIFQTLPDLEKILSEKQLAILKELIETHVKNNPNNMNRTESIFLTAEGMAVFYRKKYEDFIKERKKELDMNNCRSQVQFLLLKYAHLGMGECLDMTAAEPFEVKRARGTQYLKENHGIEVKPLQFCDNLQSYGSNLINFYDLMNSARKSVREYYPVDYQKEFELFFKEQENQIFPDPSVAKSIAAVKIVGAYQGKKIATDHPDYEKMCQEIESYLQSTTLEDCLAYIKKKDEPAEVFFRESLDSIYDTIKEYYDNTVPYSLNLIQSPAIPAALAQKVGKTSYSCPVRPSSEGNALRVVSKPNDVSQRLIPVSQSLQEKPAMQIPVRKISLDPMPSVATVEKPVAQTPVMKMPSYSSIEEQRKKPLPSLPPRLPKSYSANDVVTAHPAPPPPLSPGLSLDQEPPPAHPENTFANHNRVRFFAKNSTLSKRPPPPVPGRVFRLGGLNE